MLYYRIRNSIRATELLSWTCIRIVFNIFYCFNYNSFRKLFVEIKWAASWQNQQNDCASSEDSDQPGHPPRLVIVVAVGIHPVWSESSLCAQWVAKDPSFLLADSKDTWAGRTCHFVGFVTRWLKCQFHVIIWATSWENLFMPYANNKCADQPAHLRSLISAFVVRCLDR